jgi:hypothetical protein
MRVPMDEQQKLLDDLARRLTLRNLTTDEQAREAIDESIADIESRLAEMDQKSGKRSSSLVLTAGGLMSERAKLPGAGILGRRAELTHSETASVSHLPVSRDLNPIVQSPSRIAQRRGTNRIRPTPATVGPRFAQIGNRLIRDVDFPPHL